MEFTDTISQLSKASKDLKREFPISHRLVIKRSFAWLLAFVVILLVAVASRVYLVSLITDEYVAAGVRQLIYFVVVAGAALSGGKLLYEELYRACYQYGIEAGNLFISKGIILKQRGAFPLPKITDVYLDRTFRDFVFGLCNLHVSTPTAHSGEFARIDGLSKKTAVGLQHRLTELLETVSPPVETANAAEAGLHISVQAKRVANDREPEPELSVNSEKRAVP